MADSAIITKNLSKRYSKGGNYALQDLSLNIEPGEVYGFLGPNGAGKSTTIRLLMNFIQPTSGNAEVLGLDAVQDSVAIKQQVGYLSGEVALYSKMTGRQFLEYMADLYGLKSKKYLNELAKRFQANLSYKIRDLSKGNRQKIGLLQAFMHQPKVLILDEPTSGLDPLMQEQFFELLKEVTASGGSVFVSSHNMAEVQRMCDRVGFIREGKLVSEQSIAQIAAAAAKNFEITFEGPAPKAELAAIKGAKVTAISTNKLNIRLRGELSPLFKVLARHKVAGISQQELNLEDEFLHFYRGKK